MHPSILLLIVVGVGAAGVHGRHDSAAAVATPAVRFWEEALPGSPMPEAIAYLVQEGIAHSTLKKRYSPATAYNPVSRPQQIYGYGEQQTHGVTLQCCFFFHEALVGVGNTMTVYLPPATTTAILPLDVAQKVPFGSLKESLATFNIKPGSIGAAAVDETLRGCRERPLPGEQTACATSLKGTVRAATRMLGSISTSGSVWAAASALSRRGLPRQQYVVRSVTQLGGDHHVGCHDEAFPYAVFHCHMTAQPTRAYAVSLQDPRGGPEVAMAAICHLDTSNWDPKHPAFKMLHSQPGGAPVCHFLPYANMVFGEKKATKA